VLRNKCSSLSFEAGVRVRFVEYLMYVLLFRGLRKLGGERGAVLAEPCLDSQAAFGWDWSAVTGRPTAPLESVCRKGSHVRSQG